jgi:dephospho-CoA kinase
MDGDMPGQATRPLLIGLTGPIGCGKSNVGRVLGELGGTVIDADELAHETTSPGGGALDEVRARFGEGVFDERGTLDRRMLGDVVFRDREALADLERIIHPHVRTLFNAALARAAAEHVPFVALEAIKLVEGGLAARCDEVWLIECAPATQRARLAKRGASPDDIERRIATQGPDLARHLTELLADRAGVRHIATEGSLAQTRAIIEDALADALEAYLARG